MSSSRARNSRQTQRFDRPCAGKFQEPQAKPVRRDLVDAEVVHRLTHVEIDFPAVITPIFACGPPEVMMLFSRLARSHATMASRL
jgi:hypothetical protein